MKSRKRWLSDWGQDPGTADRDSLAWKPVCIWRQAASIDTDARGRCVATLTLPCPLKPRLLVDHLDLKLGRLLEL